MVGAIIGDIVGSRFEFDNIKTKTFEFLNDDCYYTDDTVMTIAIGKSLLEFNGDYKDLEKTVIDNMRYFGKIYPYAGYGGMFINWLFAETPKPYNSYGNGSAMRVSACGIVGKTIEEVKQLSRTVTQVTHNHPEALLAAEATSVMIFMSKTGFSKSEMLKYTKEHYYNLDFTLDEIRSSYQFTERAKDTVPYSFQAFFEANDYEDAIRNAISIGGDSDTLAAITGGIAAEFYGIPKNIFDQAYSYLDSYLKGIVNEFEDKYPSNIITK